jgi:formylglycine-generating enzyme required for sulfatase activity
MSRLKFLGQTYSLPAVVNERFRRLQQRVYKQSRSIQEGIRPRSGWLKPIGWSSTPSTQSERFQQLNLLLRNYDAIIDELSQSKNAYRIFFSQLAAGVRQALSDKRKEMLAIEQERLASYQEAVAKSDETLQQLAQEDEERLLRGVRLLGQAALLLLKKIAVCQESIAKLDDDQQVQRRALTQMIGHLDSHRRAYERRERIDIVVREVAEMANVALDFEGYVREHLCPLQDLIDKVVRMDKDLHRAVTEIDDITQRMLRRGEAIILSEDRAQGLTSFDERLLDFLTWVKLQKERLSELSKLLKLQDGSAEAIDVDIALSVTSQTTENPVLNALDNIQTLVDIRLTPLISNHTAVLETHLHTHAHRPVVAEGNDEAKHYTVWNRIATNALRFGSNILTSSDKLALEFVRIPSGTFSMGSMVFDDEKPVHEVKICRPFYLGKCLVSQSQWEAVMGMNPSFFQGNPNRPVENVSWNDIQEFIARLNRSEEGLIYRLPTEAEWEYAARAGSVSDYSFGSDSGQLGKYAWFRLNSDGSTQAVHQRKPNEWDLYDMYGNVWEWVQDWYDEEYYANSPHHDPLGPLSGSDRVLRGGACDCDAGDCRSASRNIENPDNCDKFIGFRLVRVIL